MTYATAAAQRDVKIRVLVKIAGVPFYLTDFVSESGVYDDGNGGGDTHGEQTCYPHIVSASYSAGSLDHSRHRVSQSTLTIEVLDSAQLRAALSRRAAVDYLTESIDDDDTEFDVADGSAWSSGGYAHVGRETMLADNSGGTLTVNRGMLGTVAEAHPLGAAISTTPRHWIGRMAWLVLGAYDGASWAYEDPHRVYRISSTPSFANGVWTIELSDGLDIDEREIYVGFEDVKCSQYIIAQNSSNELCTRFKVDNSAHFAESSEPALYPLSVLLDVGGQRGVFEVNDVDTTNDWIEVLHYAQEFYSGEPLRVWLGRAWGESQDPDRVMRHNVLHPLDATARPVMAMRDGIGSTTSAPAKIALWCLLSRYGAAANAYDYLPGVAPAENVPERRMGAALTTDEVDVASFLAVLGQSSPSQGFVLGASGPMSVGEFLSEHICPVAGCYHYVNSDGKIALISYDPSTVATSSALSVTDANSLGSDNAVDDESTVIARVKVNCGWTVQRGDFGTVRVSHYSQNDQAYGRDAREVEISSQLSAADEASALAVGERLFARWGAGCVRYSLRLPWAAHALEPGQCITLTNARLPSQTSSTLGVSGELCEVVRVSPDLDSGHVQVEVASTVQAQLIAPCAEVVSVSGDDVVVSLLYGSGAADTEFAADWYLIAFNPTDGAARAGVGHIASISGTTFTLDANITGLSAGDILLLNILGEDQSSETASYSGAEMEDFAYIDNTGNVPANRWA